MGSLHTDDHIAPGVETTSECPKDTQDLMRGHRAKY